LLNLISIFAALHCCSITPFYSLQVTVNLVYSIVDVTQGHWDSDHFLL